ncbi:hypothetical protein KR059_002385 [Drosophila kikkawai]|nr:hypothetical protein KR059_002385 [Drosophila kikkawai]
MVASQRTRDLCRTVRLKSTQVFIVAGTCLITVLITLLCIGFMTRYEVENEVANVADVDYWKDRVAALQKIWYDKGIEELNEALRTPSGPVYPRNLRIFVVQGIDGRDLAVHRFPAREISQGHANFVWDQYPHLARLKNSCSQRFPCPVGGLSRAFWTGIPLEKSVEMETECRQMDNQTDSLMSVLRQAQLAGLRTGFVTTQRLTGSTGAALYGNSLYECDERMPMGFLQSGCQDVARQLISGETGKALNVIIGGGRQMLSKLVPQTQFDPVDELLCQAGEGRNLLKEWRNQKLRQSKIRPIKFDLIQRTDELESLNASRYDHLMGVMANGDLSGNPKAPSFKLMVEKSLEVLEGKNQGYLLIVEQVREKGVNSRRQLQILNHTLVSLPKDRDTLTLVLFTNGIYPKPSLDVSEETESISYLSEIFNEEEIRLQERLQQMPSESLLFAQGPRSTLFVGLRNETYLAHAIAHVLSRSKLVAKL